ncbi:hypothetical protein HIM_11511 [Hirsutella minnesotensis 3608]|uniref:FAD-dependent oxidoreductase 2 FAD-binding domain-containing protein n=1 Tax=Hirsutella minnesotensis 3608 TaxID=1043627 RepID=A0A0F8A134_9HYPO|nr:hypothetical protein HIM_11511 [Hirsutella minnesotensis 3608]
MRSSCLVHWASSLKTIIEASFMCTKPDVIVVGAGLAGMSAAIAAAAQGASVVVIDRGHGGGTSAVSGGVVYAGGGTRQQAIAGYGDDSPENMCRYLALEVGSAVSDATLSTFCRESVHMIEWLESLGAKFEGTLCPFRTSFPTSQYSLYFSGNEKARPFSDVARPAPRGHRAVAAHQSGMSMTGRDLWQAVFESALHIGIKFHAASWVQELRLDTRGAVGGIRFRVMSPDAPLFRVHKALTRNAAELHAMSMQPVAAVLDRIANFIWDRQAKDEEMHSGAVILAAGSYIRDKGLSRQYIPWSYRVATLGTAGDDGGGIRLAQSVGAAVDFLNHSSVSRMLYPPESLSEGIVVSPNVLPQSPLNHHISRVPPRLVIQYDLKLGG